MSKQHAHFAALGYEPTRMKPVHFASGFFLSVSGYYHKLEWLNKTAVIKHKSGLQGDYTNEDLLECLKDEERIKTGFNESELKSLRVQVNGVVDNDKAVFADFLPYKRSFGNDYTLVSDRVLTCQKRLDGFAGHFIHQILETTEQGKQVIDFSRHCITKYNTPIERFLAPLLEDDDEAIEWENPYSEKFGIFSQDRLQQISKIMESQTLALSILCENLSENTAHTTQLRDLIIGLCSWLFLYIQKGPHIHGETPLMFMDFLGGTNPRTRANSRNSFSRQREYFFGSYLQLRDSGRLDCEETDFELVEITRFKFLEQHFSDLAVRIGFAQPRAFQARRKHFELQPDTARILLKSIVRPNQIMTFSEVAQALRNTWGICFGGCDDDQSELRSHGYTGLDYDDDLESNSEAFITLIKRMKIAVEPSDGLVLCAANPEALL